MIKLLKFEIIKKWKLSLGVLIGYFLIYFGAIIKFKSEGLVSFEQMPLQLVFFIILASTLGMAAFISGINSLRVEVKQSSRDLYFSIPLTAYAKVGSKLIIALVEMGLATVIGIFSCIKAMEQLTGFAVMKEFLKLIGEHSTSEFILMIVSQIVAVALSLLIIYLSFAIFRSFFSQVRFGGFITVIIYVVLMYLHTRYVFPLINSDSGDLVQVLLMTGYTAFIFGLVGFLFEKKVSFD